MPACCVTFARSGLANPLQIVNDGEQAIAYLAGEPPYTDRRRHPLPILILLDLKLPRRSGLDVLAWVRGVPNVRRLPVDGRQHTASVTVEPVLGPVVTNLADGLARHLGIVNHGFGGNLAGHYDHARG